MKELHLTHPRRPRGGQSGREKRRDKSFQALCLKTFVAPFLPARLTAPGSPRMHLTVHFTRFRIGGKRRKQLAWAKTKIREVVRRGKRVLSLPPSPGPRFFPFSPTAEPGPRLILPEMTDYLGLLKEKSSTTSCSTVLRCSRTCLLGPTENRHTVWQLYVGEFGLS